VYLYSPEGRKFRSKTELEAYIREHNLNVNIGDFCFTVRGQRLLDLAASHDCNGQWNRNKRKQNSSQEMPIDGRLENTSSSTVDAEPPRRKRMRLWEGPVANSGKASVLPVNSDSHVVGTSKKASKKINAKNILFDNQLQPVNEASVHKDKDLFAKPVVKSPNTKQRRASQKLTVQMKFMPPSSKKLQADSFQNKPSSHSQISRGACLSASNADIGILTSGDEASPSMSASKQVSKQNGPRHKKPVIKQQSEQYTSIRPQISPAKGCTPNRKCDLIFPMQNIANGGESSTDIQWIPPPSPFNLVEESLFHSSWKILVASIIFEHGQGE